MSDTEVEERGTLEIAHVVVRKVAERAADNVSGTVRIERKIAGVGAGLRGASVKVSGHGSDIDLLLDVAVQYPAAVRDVVDQVRTAVTEDVQHMTSYRVRGLNVTVSALLGDTPARVS
ncbi:Asp23/Gls24 family envelope stress response protein [Prauserella cavernicola]|uniref:Asp23/Gls24 family envelope stress response protein n=1 Tax=Prauserella cavernicola TaxID=2800127 RepID=A0A934QNT6_9PSEU|nr:Asp23/Gls24 family envelope stress response protein [Prauserella cavernicola]MBK1783377.1 Asp23/Gls24 family envelope stress response protein [Prauserella cavernicola]